MAKSARPEGRRSSSGSEVLYWRVTDKRSRSFYANALSLLAFVVACIVFGWLAGSVGGMSGLVVNVPAAVLLVVAIPTTILLHEAVHAGALRLMGARPRFGALPKQLFLYTAAPGYPLTRPRYLFAIAAPLVIISICAVAAMALLAGTPLVLVAAGSAVVNAAGSAGDLMLIAVALRYPAAALFTDEPDGVRISAAVE